MSDTSRHDPTRRDDVHTLSLRELEALTIQAGIVMSRRQLMRHCKSGTFDATKIPVRNNIEEWFIAPGSVEKGIADIKALQALRDANAASRRDMSLPGTTKSTSDVYTDMTGYDATRPDVSATKDKGTGAIGDPDASRYVAQLEKRIDEKDEVIGLLKTELTNRNEEIVRRNERERETNILIRGLQNLVLRLQAPTAPAADVLDGNADMAGSEGREVGDPNLSPHTP